MIRQRDVYRITFTVPSFVDGSPMDCFEDCYGYEQATTIAELLRQQGAEKIIIHAPRRVPVPPLYRRPR